MSTPTVPSPAPPWSRPIDNPRTNTIPEDGTIDLRYDATYFDNSVSKKDGNNVNIPWVVTLPDGNFKRQIIRLYIPGANLPTSPATWNVTGTFAGFSAMLFTKLGSSAVLEWDGTSWQIIGGNATPS